MTVPALTLSYRGGAYCGWQRQPNGRSVQETVEEALTALAGERVRIVGAGRTDRGVHARGQVAHVEWESGVAAIPDRALVYGANHRLPEDIRVLQARRMPAGFHARKHAASKQYTYRWMRADVLSPLDAPFCVRVGDKLDVESMRRAATVLVGRHDFSAFALAGGAHRSPVREILRVELADHGPELRMSMEGTGFLRGMVRSIAGTLLEVGEGKRSETGFAALLRGGPRSEAGATAPARGLVLDWVRYGEEPVETTDAEAPESG